MTDFKDKMHPIRFRLGSTPVYPRPCWGSLQRSPDALAGFGGSLRSRGRGGLGKRRGSGGEGKRGPPSYCWTRAPQSLATPLIISESSQFPVDHLRWYLRSNQNDRETEHTN